jgi:predicted solute-binding protein
VVRVVRIRYAHSEPLFWRAKVEAVEAGNLESARLLAGGAADLGFMPITLAAELGMPIVPRLAIYSVGSIISARLFKGRGEGFCAVSETTVSALALNKLLGLSFRRVEDPWAALEKCGGVLVVGDEALRMADRGVPHLADVGEVWQERVGTPLFFAVLAARPGAEGLEEAVTRDGELRSVFLRKPGPCGGGGGQEAGRQQEAGGGVLLQVSVPSGQGTDEGHGERGGDPGPPQAEVPLSAAPEGLYKGLFEIRGAVAL